MLDTTDLQDYSRNSNSPKTPIIKFRTFEHFLKFFPDAKLNPKFRTFQEFSGWYGNPTFQILLLHKRASLFLANVFITLRQSRLQVIFHIKRSFVLVFFMWKNNVLKLKKKLQTKLNEAISKIL